MFSVRGREANKYEQYKHVGRHETTILQKRVDNLNAKEIYTFSTKTVGLVNSAQNSDVLAFIAPCQSRNLQKSCQSWAI